MTARIWQTHTCADERTSTLARELGVSDLGARAWGEFEAGRRGDVFDRSLAAAVSAC